MGQNHYFINKNNIKKHIACNMESIACIASDKVKQTDLENYKFQGFKEVYTNIFLKKVILTKDQRTGNNE